MKKWFLSMLVVALSIPLQNCQSNQVDSANNCIKVKIVGYICAEAIFQILDPAYFHLGELQWGADDIKYDHVFHSFLTCTDLDFIGKLAAPTVIGRELYVEVIDKNTDINCAVCKATFGNAPKTTLNVKFRLQGCE